MSGRTPKARHTTLSCASNPLRPVDRDGRMGTQRSGASIASCDSATRQPRSLCARPSAQSSGGRLDVVRLLLALDRRSRFPRSLAAGRLQAWADTRRIGESSSQISGRWESATVRRGLPSVPPVPCSNRPGLHAPRENGADQVAATSRHAVPGGARRRSLQGELRCAPPLPCI
jgi:hypothetical protein